MYDKYFNATLIFGKQIRNALMTTSLQKKE